MMPAEKASKTHRAMEILDTLRRLGGSARTSHLADSLGVSEETIRRTVKKLSREGLVNRVHGGVFLADGVSPLSLHRRIGTQGDEKRRMARLVAALVPDGASLFMDVGSSTTYVAEALRARASLMVVTNSLIVAQTLTGHAGNRVFIAPGEVAPHVGGAFGASAQEFVCRFQMDMAILSADAVDPEQGFLLADFDEAQLARCFVRQSRRVVMVADHTKFAAAAPVQVCPPSDISLLVTDRSPPPDLGDALARWQVDLRIAPATKGGKKDDKASETDHGNDTADTAITAGKGRQQEEMQP